MATTRRSSESSDGSKLFRIVMLGQGGSGKSNVVDRFVKNIYTDPHKITLGVEFQTKALVLDSGIKIKFEIWDTSGQERYHALAPMYYRGAHAAIVVYDITDRLSYERAKTWVVELQQKALTDMVIALVGNKVDIAEHRVIDSMDAEVYADDNNMLFAELSAKTGIGIQEMFDCLAIRLNNQQTSFSSSSLKSTYLTPPISPTFPVRPRSPSGKGDVIKLGQTGNGDSHSSSSTDSNEPLCSCGSLVISKTS